MTWFGVYLLIGVITALWTAWEAAEESRGECLAYWTFLVFCILSIFFWPPCLWTLICLRLSNDRMGS